MNLAKLPTLAFALIPALVHAHPGHPALPGHHHAAGFLDSPALGLVAGAAVVVLIVFAKAAARALPRRARTTATKRR